MSPRRTAAVRRLALLLLERAQRGRPPDAATARRLLGARLVPEPAERDLVVEEARALCRAAAAGLEKEPGLAGEVRTGVRIALKDRRGAPFSVLVPCLVLRPDQTAAVLALLPAGDRRGEARVRRYRLAASRLTGRPVDAFVVRPDGRLDRTPPGRSVRSG